MATNVFPNQPVLLMKNSVMVNAFARAATRDAKTKGNASKPTRAVSKETARAETDACQQSGEAVFVSK